MLKIYETYAPRANPPDANYPLGSAKNVTVPGAKDGTPLDNKWGNNIEGFHQALLAEAGIVANGAPDKVGNSQLLDAVKIASGPVLNSMSDLFSSLPSKGKIYTTLGYLSPGDGGSTKYRWDETSSLASDAGVCVKPSSISGVGRFIAIDDNLTAQQYGCVGNGVSDDSARLLAYIAYCNSYKKIFINKSTIKTTTESFPNGIIMPPYGFDVGPVYIRGAKVVFKEMSFLVGTGKLYCDELLFSGVRSFSCDGFISDGGITIDGSQSSWGTFWNSFGDVACTNKLIFDCDKGQSINQNNFGTCKISGGVEIKGINTTGIRECHSNIFASLDTSGTSSIHLQNNSNLNQTNTVQQWYADVGGSTITAKGNWNIFGSNVDTGSNGSSCSERNHYLFSNENITRNKGDFFAAHINNAAVGGEWDILASEGDRPYCLNPYGTTISGTTYSTTGCPSNIQNQYARLTSSSNSGFSLSFLFDSQKTVSISIWYKGDDFSTVYSDGGEYVSPSVFTHSSGWKLARATVGKVTSSIVLLMNESSASTKNISINSIRASDGKTCFLPSKQNNDPSINGISANISAGSTFTIPLNLNFYEGSIGGIANVQVHCPATSPTFAGYRADANFSFTKTRYNNIDNSTSIGSISKSVGQFNTSGKDISISGTTSGIQITLATGVGASTVKYKLNTM